MLLFLLIDIFTVRDYIHTSFVHFVFNLFLSLLYKFHDNGDQVSFVHNLTLNLVVFRVQ